MVQVHYRSPIGILVIQHNTEAIISCQILEEKKINIEEYSNFTIKIIDQLNQYFNGDLTKLTIPVQISGTSFQRAVWNYVQRIPYGQTTTYGTIAKALGNINKSRAVGMTNGQNNIALFVPCHRVIGANNKLVGYRWGLETKRRLLAFEMKNRYEKSGQNTIKIDIKKTNH